MALRDYKARPLPDKTPFAPQPESRESMLKGHAPCRTGYKAQAADYREGNGETGGVGELYGTAICCFST
ncbi:hypothetical protein E4U53_008080 [Claviceps sorghi]|nr:hypothetical protein E4U53_008080 [Claviceps sorghi]